MLAGSDVNKDKIETHIVLSKLSGGIRSNEKSICFCKKF